MVDALVLVINSVVFVKRQLFHFLIDHSPPQEGLNHAALGQIGQEGEPEGVVAPTVVEGGVEQEEGG